MEDKLKRLLAGENLRDVLGEKKEENATEASSKQMTALSLLGQDLDKLEKMKLDKLAMDSKLKKIDDAQLKAKLKSVAKIGQLIKEIMSGWDDLYQKLEDEE